MGFGSGGGGFTPSPNNVPGSTITGTDKDSDTHQITGSVDITGSLQINGVQITQNGGGGGGGSPGGANTQVQFNNNGSFGGSANFTFDGNTITVSDDSDIAAKIGRVNIGAVAGGTADYAYFSHRDQASTNNYALQQRADGTTIVNAPSAGSLSLRLGQQNCLVVDGARNNNIGINGNPEARLHVSANTNEKDVFRADGDINNILYVSGSGKVGIGTGTPESTLEVRSTSTQQKWSYDDDNEFTVTVGDNGETVLAVSGAVGASPASDLVFDVSRGGDIFFRRSGDRLRFGISTGDTFIQTDNQNSDMSFRVHPNAGLGAVGTEIFRVDASGAGALLVSGTISTAGGDAPINFRDTATSIHSPGSNRLALTAPTLEVTGTLGLNGTSLTSTAAELNLLDAGATQHTASVLAAIPKLAKATYDFAEFGGGQSTFTLTGVTIPDNAMIVGGWVDTETNPASAGSATIAFGMTVGGVTDMFLGATPFNQFASETGGQLVPVNQATPAQYMKMAAASTLTCTIGGANLTAGKLHIYLQYVVGA